MPTVLSKSRKAPPKTKLCLHCHCTRSLSEFYSNRNWVEQNGKDVWCKSCVAKCDTKDKIREYFFENNRDFTEALWANACKRAEQQCITKKSYQNSNEDRKQVILEHVACSIIPTVMQMPQNYKYVDNTQDVHTNTYEEAKENGKVVEISNPVSNPEKKDPNIKEYSEFFNGHFKPAELKYLEEYYEGLEKDFELSDTSLRDNAKKLAKASLLVDKVQNDYMSGKCQLQDVKDAIAQYDLLMKTGNFAACKRKPEDKNGLGSWAQIAFYCETNGHPMQRKIEWEKDDVDKTIDEFRYLIESLDLDTR